MATVLEGMSIDEKLLSAYMYVSMYVCECRKIRLKCIFLAAVSQLLMTANGKLFAMQNNNNK